MSSCAWLTSALCFKPLRVVLFHCVLQKYWSGADRIISVMEVKQIIKEHLQLKREAFSWLLWQKKSCSLNLYLLVIHNKHLMSEEGRLLSTSSWITK